MKLKIPKSFNMDKWLQKIEPWARFYKWVFVIILAIVTIAAIHDILSQRNPFLLWLLWIALFFFIFIEAVFYSEYKSSPSTEVSPNTERPSRNRWLSIGLILAVVIIAGLTFLWRQLPTTPERYQTFFTAFAAIGAWVTGIAIAVFAYQQYKLRQTEHRLLFEPQLVLTSGDISIDGLINKKDTYRIRWIVFVQNTSEIPILIQHMQVHVRLVGEDSGRQANLTPLYCHVTELASLSVPFEVNRDKPQRLVWIVEGSSAGDVFDYISGGSGKRDFELVFRVVAIMPHDLGKPMFFKETTSWPIYVPQNANW